MKYFSYFIIAGLTLAACNQNELESADAEYSDEICFSAEYPSSGTRATDTSFEANDQIGIYLTDATAPLELIGNVLNNQQYTYNGSKWTATLKTYWNKGTYNAYAYYPYSGSVTSVEDFAFAVKLDQSSKADYEASDFLWASAKNVTASSGEVKLPFQHRLSKLQINLQKDKYYEGELPEEADVYIHNVVAEATIDLATGNPIKDNMATSKTIKARKLSRGVYTAIVVPQRISTRMPLIEVISNGVSYIYEAKFNFKAGVKHNLDLYISKNPEQIKIELGGEIVGW